VAAANSLADERLQRLLRLQTRRHAVGGRAIAADRRHQQLAMARVVKTMTTRMTKKVRAMMARATRAMTETSPREEGDNRHNNQLSTKVVAVVRTVVAIYGRQCKINSSGDQDGQWRQDPDGQQQRRWATAEQWVAEWQN
jgi:hypothetical protein